MNKKVCVCLHISFIFDGETIKRREKSCSVVGIEGISFDIITIHLTQGKNMATRQERSK